jgi:hypothetical protein
LAERHPGRVAGIAIGAAAMLFFRGGVSDERMAQGVRDAIMANPEMLPEAMEELARREAASAVSPRRAQFETPFAGAWAGAADGDVTLVSLLRLCLAAIAGRAMKRLTGCLPRTRS